MANNKDREEKKQRLGAICKYSSSTAKKHDEALCKCSSRTDKKHKEALCKVGSARKETTLKISNETEWIQNIVDSWHSWLTCLVSFHAGFVCFGIHCNFGLLHRVLVSRHRVHSATTGKIKGFTFIHLPIDFK